MKFRFAAVLSVIFAGTSAHADEPNETFETATILSPGVLTVADELTSGTGGDFPDTLLGIRDLFGDYYAVGDGSSGFGEVPTNYPGSIDFSVTGFGDDSFVGSHNESGQYEVFVRAYDFFDDLVDSFSEVRTLEPGIVHDFSFNNFEWINGSYDVYVDNPVSGGASDVDFFTFTGLTPGAEFTARTADPNASLIDTMLGLFDTSGNLVAFNDDEVPGGPSTLSRIDGTVPTGGTLTFGVTGWDDVTFVGAHPQVGTYELRLELEAAGLAGDYNGNNVVDAADYVVWRNTLNQSGSGLPADGNNNGEIDQGDYTFWRARFGQTGATGSANAASGAAVGLSSNAVPEPTSLALFAITAVALTMPRRRRAS